MSNTINPTIVAIYLDRIETLTSIVLDGGMGASTARPILMRDYAELRAACGLTTQPAVRTGRSPRVQDTPEAKLAGKMAEIKAGSV
jgi:hypothetical protein